MCYSRGRGFTITFRNIKAICKDEGQSRCQRIMSWVVAAVLVEKRLGIIGYCSQIWALVLETGPVALHKVKEGHGSIWTTFKSCIKVISVGSVMCFSSSSYCFSSSHFFDHGWHRWQKMDGHNVFTIKTYWKRVRSQYQTFSEWDYEFSSGTRDQEHHGEDRVCYGGLKLVLKL